MKLTQEHLTIGRARFLEAHPQAKTQVMSMTQAVADALGVELAEIQAAETHKEIDAKAKQAGEDSFEYFLRYALDDEAERLKWIDALKEEKKRVLGLL